MDIICHLNGSLITTHIPGSGYYIKIQALRVNGELILNTSLKQDPTSANIVIRIQNINGHISNHVFQGIHDSFHVDLNAGVVGVPGNGGQAPPLVGGLPQRPQPGGVLPANGPGGVGLPGNGGQALPLVGGQPQRPQHGGVLPGNGPGGVVHPGNVGQALPLVGGQPQRPQHGPPCGQLMAVVHYRGGNGKISTGIMIHGRLYSKNLDQNNNTYWCCSQKATGCRATAKTNQFNVLVYYKNHTC